jgi:hypothetical protein
MKTLNLSILTFLSIFCVVSCTYETEYEPSINSISATSNNLIKAEYKYGDVGGKFSIYDSSLSSDGSKIGFYGGYGYDTTLNCVGELDINGNLLWQKTVDNVYSSRYLTTASSGYFFYGGKKVSGNTEYFLYCIQSQQISEINLLKPEGKNITSVRHIEHLANGNYLICVLADGNTYYGIFTFANNTLNLSATWIESYWIAISSVIAVSDGYELSGILTESGKILCRKVKQTSNAATLIWEKEIDYCTNVWAKGTCVNGNKIYVSYQNGSLWSEETNPISSTHIVCLDYSTGNELWRTATQMIGSEKHGRYYSIRPHNLICRNNKLHLIGQQVDFYYTNHSATRGYGGIQTFDLSGNHLKTHTFGSDIAESNINAAFVNASQLYCFGYADEKYRKDHDLNDWFIPYDGFRGWFFKVNLSDL